MASGPKRHVPWLSFRSKIYLGFGSMFLLTAGIVAFGTLVLVHIQSQLNAASRATEYALAAEQLRGNMAAMERLVHDYRSARQPDSLDAIDDTFTRAKRVVTELTSAGTPPSQRALAQGLAPLLDDYRKQFQALVLVLGEREKITGQELVELGDSIMRQLSPILSGGSLVAPQGKLMRASYAGMAQERFLRARLAVYQYVLSEKTGHLAAARKDLDAAMRAMWILVSLLDGPEEHARQLETLEALARYETAVDRLAETLADAHRIVTQELDALGARVLAKAEQLSTSAVARARTQSGVADVTVRRSMWLAVLAGALTLFTGLALAGGLVRGIVRSLSGITKALSRLAAGDQQAEVPETERKDEIGELARAFTVFKENARNLRENEARLQFALEAANDAIWEMDFKQETLTAGPRYEELMGYTASEILQLVQEERFFELYHPEDRERLRQTWDAHLGGETRSFQAEARVLHKSGEYRWILTRGGVVERDEQGEAIRMVGANTDTTELRKAEAEAHERDARYRKTVENIPGSVYQFAMTPDGAFDLPFAADGSVQAFGFSSERLVHNAALLFEMIVPEQRDIVDRAIRQSAERMRHYMQEIKIRRDDGARRWLLCHSIPQRLADGTVLWDGVAIDITGRKLAEEALRESEERLSITLNSIGDGVIAADMDGRVTQLNGVAGSLTGWEPEEALGLPCETIFVTADSESGAQAENPLSSALCTKTACSANDALLQGRGGVERHIAYTASPIRDHEGHVVGGVLVFRDITEQLTLEAQLRHSQKMESIGLLAGGIAHDFNNLLAGIMGYAELLMREVDDAAELTEYAQLIFDTANRAAQLTSQLLAFSRKGTGRREPVDVHALVTQTRGILQRTIDRRIEVRMALHAPRSLVLGDAGALENAILNLGVNARDAMRTGGVLTFATADVSLDESFCASRPFLTVPPGDYIEVSVSDTGVGMEEQTLERIFEPFFTTKDLGEGTGLGLSAVFGTIKEHGGGVDVSSAPGKGSVFRLYLPLVEEKRSNAAAPVEGSGRILLVDDEKLARDTARGMLERVGYEVIVAEGGEEAVSLYRELHAGIDLVILDLIMPDMDGMETLQALRDLDANVRVLVVSGFSISLDIDTLRAQGALDFLSKPFRVSEISRKVAELIRPISE